MNKELLMVFIPGISWILFALGGTQISSSIGGQKWVRRFVLPTVYFAFCCPFMPLLQAALASLPAIGFFCLGYGSKKPWWVKAIVGCTYTMIGAAIGISIWNIITAVGFITLFWLSNTKLTAKIFIWKICEGFFGLLVGIQLAYVLMGWGLIW